MSQSNWIENSLFNLFQIFFFLDLLGTWKHIESLLSGTNIAFGTIFSADWTEKYIAFEKDKT